MTDYGLLTTGFNRKPAAQIRADLVTNIKAISGLENARTSAGSVLGNLIDTFSNELSIAWEGIESTVQSFNRDFAESQALDAIATLIGKSRIPADYSAVTLYLWGDDTSVPAGNQVKQSSTGVLWETTADAVIPVDNVALADLDVNNITWQSGTTVRYTFSGSPNLSGAAVGDLVIFSGCGTAANNGAFVLTAVNDGSDYVEVSNPARTSSTGNETGSAGTAQITDGFVTVAARSIDKGEFAASAQSIDTINTPVTSWDGVANIAAATTGRATETDAEFRTRIETELTIAQGSTLEAVKAQLRLVDGVTYVSGDENRTGTVDGNGWLPHSQTFTVVGGADQDIADCIGEFKAAGIATNGTESATYTDPEGNTFQIYFNRATQVQPYIIVNLTTDANYPITGDSSVITALTDYSDTLEASEDLLNYRLVQAIADAEIPGVLTISVLQGLTDPPGTSANIAIAAGEICQLIADRITVNS